MGQPYAPTTDLDLHESSTDSRHSAHLGQPKIFSKGKIAMLVIANGALTDGALCGVTGSDLDTQELTTAIVTALSDGRAGTMACGFIQADAADNAYAWLLLVKPDGTDTDGNALSGASITAGAKIYTTTTGGEISGTAGANHQISNVDITTDPGSGTEFTTFKCNYPTIGGEEGISANVALTQTYSTADSTHAARTAAALTENSGAIGGTQDGDFATLSLAWDGSTDPTAAEGNLLIDAIRECADQINNLVADQADTAQFVNTIAYGLQAGATFS